MDRRKFTTLMCLLPLALAFKPKERPANQKLLCQTCGIEVATVLWPQKVLHEGTTLCPAHANRPDGQGLITEYHFDFYQDADAQAERKRQAAEIDSDLELKKIAQEVLDRLKRSDPEVFEKLRAAQLA